MYPAHSAQSRGGGQDWGQQGGAGYAQGPGTAGHSGPGTPVMPGGYASSPKRFGMPYRVDSARMRDLTVLNGKLDEARVAVETAAYNIAASRMSGRYTAESAATPGYDYAGEGAGAAGGWGGDGDAGYGHQEGVWGHALNPEIQPDKILVRESWCMKKSRGMRKRWEKRVLSLDVDSRRLICYADDTLTEAHGAIEIEANTEVMLGDDKGKHKNKDVKFTFQVGAATEEKPWVFSVDSEELASQWVATLQHVVQACEDALEKARHGQAYPAAWGGGVGSHPQSPGLDRLANTAAFEESKRIEEEEKAAAQDAAQQHTAWGTGLTEAVRGETATFTIQANDAQGNPQGMPLAGECPFVVYLANEEMEIELYAEDNGDGTYTVEYTPPHEGDFELSVKHLGQHIFGSPFLPTVLPAPTAAKHCLVTGDGAAVAVPNRTNVFTIVARDQFDEPRPAGGDQFEIVLHGPGVPYDIIDHNNGCYTVQYDVQLTRSDFENAQRGIAPSLEIEVNLHADGYTYARPIAGSPFQPVVQLGPEALAAAAAARPGTLASPAHSQVRVAGMQQPYHSPNSAPTPVLALPGYGTPASSRAMPPLPMMTPAGAGSSAAGWDTTMTRGMPTPGLPPTPMLPHHAMYSSGMSAQLLFSPSQQRITSAAGGPAALGASQSTMASHDSDMVAQRAALDAERAALEEEKRRVDELSRRVQADAQRLLEHSRAAGGSAAPAVASSPAAMPASSSAPMTAADSVHSTPARAAAPVPMAHIPSPELASAAPVSAQATPASAMSPSRSAHASEAITNPGAGAPAPDELFQPGVVSQFGAAKKTLIKVFQHYADAPDEAAGYSRGVTCAAWMRMCKDYLVVSTFAPKRELKGVFADAAKAHGLMETAAKPSNSDVATRLTFAAFTEGIGRMALVCLSKPEFAQIYPTPADKVEVVLEIWGLGNPSKLAEVKGRR